MSILQNAFMTPPPPPPFVPFVYIVDSPSNDDLIDGLTIGMALRAALQAIKIPVIYTLTSNQINFELSLTTKLDNCIKQFQATSYSNSYPFIHLCMHGNSGGVAFTDGNHYSWSNLKNILRAHNMMKGFDPFVCMASCNGLDGMRMVDKYNRVFRYLIGNSTIVLQSDLTVGYLSFYNHLFHKKRTIEDAVIAMKIASGDNNFYCIQGEQVRLQREIELTYNQEMSPAFQPQNLGGW